MFRPGRRASIPAGSCVIVALCCLLTPCWAGTASNVVNSAHAPSHADWKGQPKYQPNEVLVRFRTGASAAGMQRAHAAVSAQVAKTWNLVPGMQLVRVPANVGVREAIRRYRQNANVLYAEPNYAVHALGTPNDPAFNQLWNLQNTGQLGGYAG